MQTAQLTFNGGIATEFFAVLFLCRFWEKDRDPAKYQQSVISLFFGGFLVLKMGDTVGPRYIPHR